MKLAKRSPLLIGVFVGAVAIAVAAGSRPLPAGLQASVSTAVRSATISSLSDPDSPPRASVPVRLQTDRRAYAPGEVVVITSSGW
jgi:hypothetical protein